MLRLPAPTVLAALLAVAPGCELPVGDGERGTTRHCAPDDDVELGKACYRQCADLLDPTCTAKNKPADADVEECAKDPLTGAYLIDMDALVLPAGETECFALLADQDTSSAITQDDMSSECMDVGTNLEFVIVRGPAAEPENGVCYDFNCKVSQDVDMDCPDLE